MLLEKTDKTCKSDSKSVHDISPQGCGIPQITFKNDLYVMQK